MMFDWFKNRNKGEGKSNVYDFPTVVPPVPEPEQPATVFYRIGVTNKNRLAFQMGYSEITMNKEGVENLIRQLEVFKEQLAYEETANEM
jgi:hypothetical protein